MSKIDLDPFYMEMRFVVYDGTESTAPKHNCNLFVLLFDGNTLIACSAYRSNTKLYWDPDDDRECFRASIGDAWTVIPGRKDIKHPPKAGRNE